MSDKRSRHDGDARSQRSRPRQWRSIWLESHTCGMAPVVAPPIASLATQATPTLAYSNPSPSSHGSEMVRTDRRGLILTKPKPKKRRKSHPAAEVECAVRALVPRRNSSLTASQMNGYSMRRFNECTRPPPPRNSGQRWFTFLPPRLTRPEAGSSTRIPGRQISSPKPNKN